MQSEAYTEADKSPLPPLERNEQLLTDPQVIGDLVNQIVCAHPKSILRQLSALEVRQVDQVAVLEAARDEVKANPTLSQEDALNRILTRLRAIAEKVPKSEWRYLKDVAEFFRSHDYRIAPEEFTRNGKDNTEPSRVERSIAAVLEAGRASLEDAGYAVVCADGSAVEESGDRAGDGEDVPAGLRKLGFGIRRGDIA